MYFRLKQWLNTFINFYIFSSLFAAPVYENEQTAIESYDGGECADINLQFLFFFDDKFLFCWIYRSREGTIANRCHIISYFQQKTAVTTTIITTEKATE